MTEPKRPLAETDGSAVPTAPAPDAETAPAPDFFVGDDEHDGWGPIVKRRTPPPPEPSR